MSCLAALAAVGLPDSTALAHGTSSTSESSGMALLIFPVAAIIFVLFLVFMHHRKGWTVLVVGGAGRVGSVLVPKLLKGRHRVVVLDLYGDGDDVFEAYRAHENLSEVKGDFRDHNTLEKVLQECDAVIDLAGGAAHAPLVRAAEAAAVKRFLCAAPMPATGFAALDAECAPGFVTCTVRSGHVCGSAPSHRREDLVGGLIKQALNNGRIRVNGGSRKHPIMHIDDFVDLCLALLNQPDTRIDGKTYSAGTENLTLLELAGMVKTAIGGDLPIDVKPADDPDPVELACDDFREDLRFKPKHAIEDAVRDLVAAFRHGTNQSAVDDPRGLKLGTRSDAAASHRFQ